MFDDCDAAPVKQSQGPCGLCSCDVMSQLTAVLQHKQTRDPSAADSMLQTVLFAVGSVGCMMQPTYGTLLEADTREDSVTLTAHQRNLLLEHKTSHYTVIWVLLDLMGYPDSKGTSESVHATRSTVCEQVMRLARALGCSPADLYCLHEKVLLRDLVKSRL